MCATIGHVLNSLVYPNLTHLTILLDGGRLTKMSYEVNITIPLDPKKIISLTLKRLPSSNHTPVVYNSKFDLVFLFDASDTPTISIENIDFERMLFVRFSTSQNTTGALHITKSKWSKLSNAGYDDSFVDGGGGGVPNVLVDIELTDFTIDSSMLLPLIRYKKLDDTKWRITILRGQLNFVGLHAIVKNSTINVTDTNIFGYTPNAQYSIDLQGFDSIHMTQIHFRYETGGNYGTFSFMNVGELVITHTNFVGLPDYNWQVIRASIVSSVKVKNCNFQSFQTDTNSLTFSNISRSFEFTENNVSSHEFTEDNVLLPTKKKEDFRGNFLALSYVKTVRITKSKFEREHKPFTTSTIVISHCGEVFMKNTIMTRQWNPLIISETENVNLLNCHFKRNEAIKGAGISVYTTRYTTVKILGCYFYQNTARLQSGAINSENANFVIEDSLFVDNNANTCGTLRFSGKNGTYVNLINVVISTPSKNIPQFAVAFENNGAKLKLKNVTVDIKTSHGDIDIFTTSLDADSSLHYGCPPNTNAIQKEKALFSCKHCPKDKYSQKSSSIAINPSSGVVHDSIKCSDCPYGGSCTGQGKITSRINFWGYTVDGSIKFVQCFPNYCCNESEQSCTGINSCAANRKGRVCGKCKKFHYVNFFDNRCLPNENCIHQHWFWAIFAIATMTIFLVITYYQLIFRCLKRCCCCCCWSSNTIIVTTNDVVNDDDESSRLVAGIGDDEANDIANDNGSHFDGVGENVDYEAVVDSDNNDNEEDVPVTTVIFGSIKILFNFYQMKELIAIAAPSSSKDNKANRILYEILPSIFNLKITFQNFYDTLCPFLGLDDIMKLFIREVLIILVLIAMALTLICISKCYRHLSQWFHRRNGDLVNEIPPGDELTFGVRCKVFLARIIMIGYTNIVTFLLVLTSYVTIYVDNKPVHVLRISGEVRWGDDWRSLIASLLLGVWGIVFIPNLYFLSRRLQDRKITIDWFLIYLLFPPFTMLFLIARLWRWQPWLGDDVEEPKIKHLLSVLEDPFRKSERTGKALLWDAWIILRRLVIAAVCVYVKDYLMCYVIVIPFLAIFCAQHAHVAPYKGKFLDMVEVISFLNLIEIAAINMIWAFFYVYSLPHVDPTDTDVDVLKVFEQVSIFASLIIYGSYNLFYAKFCKKDTTKKS